MTWALYDKNTARFLKRKQETPGTADGSLPVGLDANLAWLVEQVADPQTFDPNTQRLDYTEVVVIDSQNPQTGTVTVQGVAVDLSAEEIQRKSDDVLLALLEAQVGEISVKLRANEDITSEESYTILRYQVLRDRLTEL